MESRTRNKPQARIATADAGLWRKVAGTITPLFGNKMPPPAEAIETKRETPPPSPPSLRKGEALRKPPQAPRRTPPPANLDGSGMGGISRADANRLKSGEARLAAKIDLHGMTLPEAEAGLRRFITEKARASPGAVVLVITGKGRDGEGVIRKALRGWITAADIAPHVVAYCHAQPRHGGAGAFYLKLRKPKA